MPSENLVNLFGFTDQWIQLGIVLEDLLTCFLSEYEEGNDLHKEHYRWKAFSKFLKANEFLSNSTIFALYDLGETEPDDTLGRAMMRELLDRKDTPIEVLRRAAESDQRFLVTAANRAIERRLKKTIIDGRA